MWEVDESFEPTDLYQVNHYNMGRLEKIYEN